MATFADDLAFLQQHVETIVLERDGARLIVVPAYQGRAMTSSDSSGEVSYGWVNRELIESGETRPHINPYGGEDRFWLGPEGGQYSIFFKGGDPFDLDHWQTPAPIDSEPFEVFEQSGSVVRFGKRFQLTNYSGFEFQVEARRTVSILSRSQAEVRLGLEIDSGLSYVGFETENAVTNIGEAPWKEATGLLSLWNLGMFNASPSTSVAIRFRQGLEDELGPIMKGDYFGEVPHDRLRVAHGCVLFKGDGKFRSKIGISPARATPVLGSYSGDLGALTLVQFSFDPNPQRYVNSAWEHQPDPYAGDVVNSYNDGGELGGFYELETSSPALALQPGEMGVHRHATFHFRGDDEQLDQVARRLLGIRIEQIRSQFE